MAKRKNKLAFPIGLLTVAFAIIGIASTVSFGIDKYNDIKNGLIAQSGYEEFIKPVIMFDPEPFDDLEKADKSQLMNAAIWALLMSENGTEGYSYSEGETVGIVVPQEDLESYFTYLFGTEIDVTQIHSSLDMSAYGVSYDAAQKSYILPITGIEFAYTPKVTKVKKLGDSVVLTVSYIGNKAYAEIQNGEYVAPEADKVMSITLRERDGKKYVSAIAVSS